MSKLFFFELKTVIAAESTSLRGWARKDAEVAEGMLVIERADGTGIMVPVAHILHFETLPEGHKRIPQWAVESKPEVTP